MSADLVELVHRLGHPRVLVVGDVMLDRYVWGDAERISQEAPVVLLRADRREERLGGAGSVATMLQALGAQASLFGVVGRDGDGLQVRHTLARLGIDSDGLIADPDRPTTVKERYIGRAQARHPQQMIRVDYESREPVSDATERELAAALGLTPSPYDSGDSKREQGISRSGNWRVRKLLIEIAWAWLRLQPNSQLSQWYRQRFAKGSKRMRRIGIVALARKLAIALWRWVEFGALPEGARLKASATSSNC